MKGTEMNINKFTAGVAAVLIGAASPAFFYDAGDCTVSAEKIYDVQLTAETVEIDINDIPESREVQVGVRIDNNPGFLTLFMAVEYDQRLSYDIFNLLKYDMSKLQVACGYSLESMFYFDMSNMNLNELYSENNELFKVNYILPENYKEGDYYPINIIMENSDKGRPCFSRENSLDSIFENDNFGKLTSGGIKITGQKKAENPSPEPVPTPSPSPSPQPHQEEKPSSAPETQKQENENKPADTVKAENVTTTSETGSVTTVISETGTETVSTSPVTSVETSVSETTVSTTEETTVSEAELVTTELVSEVKEKNDKKGMIISGGILGGIIGLMIYIIQKKQKEKNSGR